MRRTTSGLLAALLVAAGCSPAPRTSPEPSAPGENVQMCTMQYVYGLTVHVRSASQPVPAALTVIAREGAWADTLKPQEGGDGPGGAQPGTFVGVGERAGTYTVTASAPGYRPASRSGVVITHDGCHVRPVSLTLDLERQ